MIVLRPLGQLGTDVMIGNQYTQAGTSALEAAAKGTEQVAQSYSPASPSVSLFDRAYLAPRVVVSQALAETIPVDKIAERTVDGQSSSTIEDTQPEPAIAPSVAQESGEVMGATVDQWIASATAEAPTFWAQHKTKILIAAAVLGVYILLK